MGIIDSLKRKFGGSKPVTVTDSNPLVGENIPSTERGSRTTPENSLKYQYRMMWVDPDLRQAILDIRDMERRDGRVKKIHKRMANTAVKGGLKLKMTGENKRITKLWKQFESRVHLNKHQKLYSDAKALAMEGNLALQVVIDQFNRVAGAVRMPAETILPIVDQNGQFKDVQHAYDQFDLTTGQPMASFALWQLQIARLDPDSFDDMGSLGRPYLDATREVWKKLQMTETDLVIRRRQRAPLRMSHVLEGATQDQLDEYRSQVEADIGQITTDYYANKKGGVTPVQGDAALDQIADVNYLLDTFYAGSPAPKGLFGYTGDLARDILEDLKRDYFDEIDSMQDIQSSVYDQIFRLELLLNGINPDQHKFSIIFSERRTSTPNQDADLALKYQALGVPHEMVWDSAGLDSTEVLSQRRVEENSNDPYPEETDDPKGRVSITPGNGQKGESAVSISNGG